MLLYAREHGTCKIHTWYMTSLQHGLDVHLLQLQPNQTCNAAVQTLTW